MAEQYHPRLDESEADITLLRPETEKSNVTYVNFQPEANRKAALRRIGARTMSIPVIDILADGTACEIIPDYGEILSSEPIWKSEDAQGNISVWFLQYWQGYRGDNMGSPLRSYPRPDDRYGVETRRIVEISWRPEDKFVYGSYLHPRNHEAKIADFRAKQRSEGGRKEIEDLHRGLWGSDE